MQMRGSVSEGGVSEDSEVKIRYGEEVKNFIYRFILFEP